MPTGSGATLGRTPTHNAPPRWMVRLVQALVLLHAALFVLFLATVAAAAEASACKGENLVERLQREQPQQWQALRAEADAVANGHGRLWKVSRAGLLPSYLFATMHSPDPRVARLDGEVAAAFAESGAVLVESTEAFDREAMLQAIGKLRHLTFLADGETLDGVIEEGPREALKKATEARGMPWAVARMLRPWMIAAAIALPICDSGAKAAGAAVLDQMIGERARAEGKEVAGLETIEEQFTAVAGIPDEFHRNAIVDLLALGALADDLTETTKQLYLAGETGLMLPLARAYSPRAYAGPGHGEFRAWLISERNRRMAERAMPHLERGGVFMAVGALHLPGEDGLVELLRGRGFAVEAVAARESL